MAQTRYLTYEQYVALGHSAVNPAMFPQLELLARKRIDLMTASRVKAMGAVPEAVCVCMAALIDMEQTVGTEAQVAHPVATSFSTDGYSESYGNALSIDSAAAQMNKLVKVYLFDERDDNGIPLLYRGVK